MNVHSLNIWMFNSTSFLTPPSSPNASDDIDSDSDDSEERSDQTHRVAVTLFVLAEDALRTRFQTRGVAEDRRLLRCLGPETRDERASASVGGWHWSAEDDAAQNAKEQRVTTKNSFCRSVHRRRLAVRVRLSEKNALAALSSWSAHPLRKENEMLPAFRARSEEIH
jgi:hypothetical protein